VLGAGPVFTLEQEFGTPRLVRPFGDVVPEGAFGTSRRLVAVAGIARPERFFKTVEALGWEVAQPMVYRDHHWFTRKDVATIHDTVQTLGAGGVITTEKDAVRLTSLALPHDIAWTYVPMRASIEPAREFHDWFMARLAEACRRVRARPARADGLGTARRRTVSGGGGARARRHVRACRCCRCRPCARAGMGSGASCSGWTVFTAASRSRTWPTPFPHAPPPNAGAGQDDVRALWRPGVRAAEVRHAVARADLGADGGRRARSAFRRRTPKGRASSS
jgi:hypothetical protein